LNFTASTAFRKHYEVQSTRYEAKWGEPLDARRSHANSWTNRTIRLSAIHHQCRVSAQFSSYI